MSQTDSGSKVHMCMAHIKEEAAGIKKENQVRSGYTNKNKIFNQSAKQS